MAEEFKIYIDRLKAGQPYKIEGAFDPAFLEIEEQELQFNRPVAVRGEAYIADEHLVVHLVAAVSAEMPCSICNEMIQTTLSVPNFYHTELLTDIRDAVYDFGTPLREALLVEIPHTVECNQGNCTGRETLAPYLRSEKRTEQTTYFPFADIDLEK